MHNKFSSISSGASVDTFYSVDALALLTSLAPLALVVCLFLFIKGKILDKYKFNLTHKHKKKSFQNLLRFFHLNLNIKSNTVTAVCIHGYRANLA